MSKYDFNGNEIQLVFLNTEAININYWAINRLDFTTCGETHTFDKRSMLMDMAVELERLYMDIDITDPKHFRHVPRLAADDSAKKDGQACIDRIKGVPDITHLYINGTMYRVPWYHETYRTQLGGISYKNKLQMTSALTTNVGCSLVTVEIKKDDGTVSVYCNQGEDHGKVNIPTCEGTDAV